MATANSTSTCLISPDFGHFNITDLPDSVVPVWTVLACLNAIASPFTVIFNGLIIWAILGDHQLRSKSYFALLASLAVTDLAVGLLLDPLLCWHLVSLLTEGETKCVFTAITIVLSISSGLSLSTLMIISVERFLAIELPFFHLRHVTTKRVMIIAVALWLLVPSKLLPLTILLDNFETFKRAPVLMFTAGNILVTMYCTAKVHITAYFKQKSKLSVSPACQKAQLGEKDENLRCRMQEYRLAFMMSTLVLLSIILYIPAIIVIILQAIKGNEVTPEFKYIATYIVMMLVQLQALINPVIMLLRIKQIKRKVKKIICCLNVD